MRYFIFLGHISIFIIASHFQPYGVINVFVVWRQWHISRRPTFNYCIEYWYFWVYSARLKCANMHSGEVFIYESVNFCFLNFTSMHITLYFYNSQTRLGKIFSDVFFRYDFHNISYSENAMCVRILALRAHIGRRVVIKQCSKT